jgi:hypothetical protein
VTGWILLATFALGAAFAYGLIIYGEWREDKDVRVEAKNLRFQEEVAKIVKKHLEDNYEYSRVRELQTDIEFMHDRLNKTIEAYNSHMAIGHIKATVIPVNESEMLEHKKLNGIKD